MFGGGFGITPFGAIPPYISEIIEYLYPERSELKFRLRDSELEISTQISELKFKSQTSELKFTFITAENKFS